MEAPSGAESGDPLSVSALVGTQLLILHPHCRATAKTWWHLRCSYHVPYVIGRMTNADAENLTWQKAVLRGEALDAREGQPKPTSLHERHDGRTNGEPAATTPTLAGLEREAGH